MLSIFLTVLRDILVRTNPTILLQIFVILLMLATIWETRKAADRQISETRRRDQNKTFIALTALIEEMTYNRSLLIAYVQHCQEGAHLTEGTYELNKPVSSAYEKYLFPACVDYVELSREISQVYSLLDASGTMIQGIHDLVANSLIIANTSPEGRVVLNEAIIRTNRHLETVSNDARGRLDALILRLEQVKRSFEDREFSQRRRSMQENRFVNIIQIILHGVFVVLLFYSFHIQNNLIATFKTQTDFAENNASREIKSWQDRYESLRGDVQPTIVALKSYIDSLDKKISSLKRKNIEMMQELERLKDYQFLANNEEASSRVADMILSSQKTAERFEKMGAELSETKEAVMKINFLLVEDGGYLLHEDGSKKMH